jgi:hypothetical protein
MGFGDTFFGGGQPTPVWYSKPVSKNLNYLSGLFQGDNGTYQHALDAFNLANQNVTGQMAKNATQAQGDYNNLFQTNQNYNPLDTYNSIRSGNLGALKDFSGQIAGQGSRDDKMALAAMGMGGQPDSSYASILRSDRVSKNIAPILGNIMSSLGSDTATIGDQRNQNLANSENLINLRTNAPMIGYGLQLDPANALNSMRMNQLGQLGSAADIAKNNAAGWYTKPGIVDYWDRGMQSLSRTAAVAQQAEGLAGGMGGMGGGMGGGGGGGGGASQAFQGFQLGGMQPSASGGSAPSSIGGGGGGGGMDMNTIMSLIKMFQGGNGISGIGGLMGQQPSNPWGNYSGGTSLPPASSFQPPANFGNYGNTNLWQ